MNEKVHIFEKAGLGIAPFKFVEMYVDRGPKPMGNGVFVGAPGQPMGTCDFCGTGIANCCVIESSDGKRFIVGTDCVCKTGDKGLRAEIDKVKTAARHEHEKALIAENWLWVEENRARLAEIQYGRYTLLNSIEWFYKNAGNSGKMKIIRTAKKLLEAQSEKQADEDIVIPF